MDAKTPSAARPPSRGAVRDARRAAVEPLLAAGLSIRAIAAQTAISASAVFRIKEGIEQAKQQAQAASEQAAQNETPPEASASYAMQQMVNGVPTDVRRLTITVFERAVADRMRRGILPAQKVDDPWAVTSALFAGLFADATLRWLEGRGYLHWSDCGRAEAIIAGVNALIERQSW